MGLLSLSNRSKPRADLSTVLCALQFEHSEYPTQDSSCLEVQKEAVCKIQMEGENSGSSSICIFSSYNASSPSVKGRDATSA